MFWTWLLKYSSFLATGVVTFIVGYLLNRVTEKKADLIYYTSHPQLVIPPQQPGQQAVGPIGTFTLFLWNQGKAPARDAHIGHFFLPAHNVYPDIPREVVNTPGGGYAIRFPVIPPLVLVSISYLFLGAFEVNQILSYLGSESGAAKHIPVMLQRIFSPWVLNALRLLLLLGLWVAVNACWSLIKVLWVIYYLRG
jgi:hypothetical protein